VIRIEIGFKEMKALSEHRKLRFTTGDKSPQDVELTLSPHISMVLVDDELIKTVIKDIPKSNMN
jgi:hypothetical protein